MKTRLSLGSAVMCCLGAASAQAQDAAPRVTLGITAGSLGIGPEVGARLNRMLGVRASASFLDFNHDFDVNDIDYKGKVKLQSYGGNIDFYPFSSGLRLSGGFRLDRNKVDISATPTGPVTVGSATFTPAQIGTLSGRVRANDFAPTLTVGYAGGLTRGVKFGVDAGAMFQGSPKIDQLRSTGTLSGDPTFQAQLVNEQQQLNDEVDDYKLYPIVQLSLFYAF